MIKDHKYIYCSSLWTCLKHVANLKTQLILFIDQQKAVKKWLTVEINSSGYDSFCIL